MDLISSIIDNATAEEKATTEAIKPTVIDGGFHQPEKAEIENFYGKETAQIFTGEPAASFEDDSQLIDAEGIEQGEDFDILSDIEKKRNLLYAEMYVILIDTGAGLALQLAAGDWSEEGEKKYTISKIKRKELAEAWAEILNLEGHKKDPKTALWMMFGSFYLPLLIMAIKERVQKQRKKKEEEAQKKAKVKAAKKVAVDAEISPDERLVEVAQQLEIVPKETPEEEAARIAAQIEHANAITIEANPDKFPTQNATAELIVKPENILDNGVKVIKVEKVPQIAPQAAPAEEETRGRKKGSRKNPKTGKFEMPSRIENGYRFYPWGEKVKIPKPRKKKKK